MEEYPEELQTPPVALVALVGCPDLHQSISGFLHSEQPPINTLALPEFSKISVIARKHQRDGAVAGAASAAGILKRDWLSKHRTRVPAVVAVMFAAKSVDGDPAQWQQVCTDLDNVKAVTRGRNIKLVVVLVQPSTRDDINEDVLTTLRKRAEIDGKYLIVLSQRDSSEQRQSLSRLAGAFSELSIVYYRDEARKIKARIEKKNISTFELNIRYSFKVAIYGEFRRDWMEALKFYEDGYHFLHELVKVSTNLLPIQRLIEIKAVAEQFHFKVSTLLLHGGKVAEAITWFRKHIATYGQLVGVSEVAFLHWDWMSRQFLVFAELLETSSAAIPNNVSADFGMDNPITEWEFHPAYYYQLSASYLREKKNSLTHSLSACGFSELSDTMDASPDSVIPSVFVGQSVRLLEQGTELSMLPLNDAEYTCYALAEAKRFQDVFEIIALLRRSVESFSSLKASRMASYCTGRVAREYFASKDFSNAKKLFSEVAELYRQEGWITLLWECLDYLRHCSRELGLLKDYIEFSLEMAAMPVLSSIDVGIPGDLVEYGPGGAPSFSQRQMIQDEVIKILKKEPSCFTVGGFSSLCLEEEEIIHIEIDPVSPLRVVLLASVAFHDQSVKPGSPIYLTVALLSHLPDPLEVDQLEIQFNQAECNFIISNVQKKNSMSRVSTEEGLREENVPHLILEPNTWMQLTYTIKSGKSGKLECLSVNAKVGSHFAVCCRAESPASMEGLPLWKFEDQMKTFPTNDLDLSFSGQKVIQIEEPESQVDLVLNASGPALVGETFTVPVLIRSKGHPIHSGELKINIMDAQSGGLMSPREIEASSDYDSHHVELLSVSGILEDDPQKDVDSIKKITQSFGVVPIPVVGVGESWVGNLEIKWHKPKQVMLYVSLGYSPNNIEVASHKVNVHTNLQIEGKIPLVINHKFMLPFRREPLLLSNIRLETDSDKLVSLALNESSVLVATARNICEIPLCLENMWIKTDGGDGICSVNCVNSFQNAVLKPQEEFKQVFVVVPCADTSKLDVGSICVKWSRHSMIKQKTDHLVLMEQKLPYVHVEGPPLIVSLDCPPHAVLGIPFMVYVRVQNLTKFLQEIKYSLGDSQSFLFSGSHKASAFILPNTEKVIPYTLVPLCCGHQQLPRFSISSLRYSAGFQTSASASTIFIFPSEPHFNHTGVSENRSAGVS